MSEGKNNCQNFYSTSIYISVSQAKYLKFNLLQILAYESTTVGHSNVVLLIYK